MQTFILAGYVDILFQNTNSENPDGGVSWEKSDMCLLGLQVPQRDSSYTLHYWSQTNTPILFISDELGGVLLKDTAHFFPSYVNIPINYWPNF